MQAKPRQQGRFRRAIAGLLVTALGAAAGCSAHVEAKPGSSSQAISGGRADVSYRSVFLLVAHHDDASSTCTATLLAPNLLLTARHCVSPGSHEDVLCGDAGLGAPYPPSAFFTTNDPKPRDGSPVFRAVDIRVPIQGGDTCGFDIALVLLSENVPATLATPAVPRIDREVQPGEVYTAVGYGVDETGQSTGARMERGGLSIACEPGTCGSGVESTEFVGETGICSGDSGGPAIDSDGKIVGVVSRGGPNCGTPIYGTVTAWRDFLVSTAQEAAVLGGYEPSFWVTTGLSDPPVVVGTGGAASGPDDPAGGEGDACTDSSCGDGLACYTDSGHADAAVCVRECTASSDCAAGLVCQNVGGSSVCLEASGGADDLHGCALAPRKSPHGQLGWLALAVLGLLIRRSRR
jgi:MYXO-CTERM domain-containing protein